MKYIFTLFLLTSFLSVSITAQDISEPNYALKTPQTLEVINIELSADLTIINLSIENRIEGGYFCIDKNSFLITDRGEKVKLSELIGLPLCPDSYMFNTIGEKKYFTLKFPHIHRETAWVDLIEDCGDNCLAVYAILLDKNLNKRINACFRELDSDRKDEAIVLFESLRKDLRGSNNPLLGSIYLNLITLYTEAGNNKKIDMLKSEFENSQFPHKELFVFSK